VLQLHRCLGFYNVEDLYRFHLLGRSRK
jgi:hypothetical protein